LFFALPEHAETPLSMGIFKALPNRFLIPQVVLLKN
jgi:hypothetical protein